MVATRLLWGVVNQVYFMSNTTTIDPRFEISYIPKHTGSIPCYMVAVPSYLGDKVCAYLRHHGCKFQQRWSEKRYGRCEFFIERIEPNLVQILADRTYANNGKVNLGAIKLTSSNAVGIEVELSAPCPLMNDQLLTIKVNGSEDFIWDCVPNIDVKLKTFIEMAIQGIERDIVYNCGNADIRIIEVFEQCGFTFCDDDIPTMRYFNT